MGWNLYIAEREKYTVLRGTAHYYQQIVYGVGKFAARGVYEMVFGDFLKLFDPYHAPGYQEFGADLLYKAYK